MLRYSNQCFVIQVFKKLEKETSNCYAKKEISQDSNLTTKRVKKFFYINFLKNV